jgi:aspartate-semialdehyde dehydrogenase
MRDTREAEACRGVGKVREKAKYNVAVVGVGAVGVEMLRVLKQRNFPLGELRVFARSARDIEVDGQKYAVRAISPEGFSGIDIALFAGTEGEKGAAVTFAPEAIKRGAVVIDNGADFRLKEGVPLVVPEVNSEDAKKHQGLIANPNCSTIQMVVTIAPIYKAAGIKRIVVSSYQAVSGAGRGGLAQLENELQEKMISERTFAHQIAENVIPQIGSFGSDGYTSEELKMVHETHKIMHDDKIKITATCVRVPVSVGHSEAIYLETEKPVSPEEARELLKSSVGVEVIDDLKNNLYPMPINAADKDAVYVGRIRRDPYVGNGLWLWCVSDNLRKGAALNAVQIGELIVESRE